MNKKSRSPLRLVLDAIWACGGDSSLPTYEQKMLAELSEEDQQLAHRFAKEVSRGSHNITGRDLGGISSRNLSLLPGIDDLKRVCQSIAMLDSIIYPEWQGRYYSFNSCWGPGAMCGSMRNGSGDDFFIHFSAAGALIKGFAHEYPLSPWARLTRSYHGGRPGIWPGIIEDVPGEFNEALKEPAFNWEATTFCIWRRYIDPAWRTGEIDFPEYDICFWGSAGEKMMVGVVEDPDGSSDLLHILDGNPRTYKAWADEYFTQTDGSPSDHDLTAIEHVYRHLPLTEEVVTRLNPGLTYSDIGKEIEQIGYPR